MKAGIRHAGMAPVLLLLIGAALRLVKFTANRSLWLDEVRLALNVLDRTPAGLMRPLDYGQVAPPGFLVLEWAITRLLGASEWAFRLVPLVAGIAAMWLVYVLARRISGPTGGLLALGLCAVADPLVNYASELKPYSSDVALAAGLILLALAVDDHPGDRRWLAGFALAGAVAVWISHPAVFVLAGAALVLGGRALARSDGRGFLRLALACAVWGISFLGLLSLSRGALRDSALAGYWADAFMPFPPTSAADIDWYLRAFSGLFNDVVEIPLFTGVTLLFLLGAYAMFRGQTRELGILVAPILLALAASGLKLYPFAHRLLLFTAPALVVLISRGAAFVTDRAGARPGWLWACLAVLLLAQPAVIATSHAIDPREQEEMRPVVDYLAEHARESDVLYLYYNAQYGFDFYARALRPAGRVVVGANHRDEPEAYLADLDSLGTPKRAWFVFSHSVPGKGVPDEEGYILGVLQCRGLQQDRIVEQGASAYLYDLSPEARAKAVQKNASCANGTSG
jgi:uncharacterized membrane protein